MKTAIDTALYAAGQKDEVKGTGVWSFFEMKRDEEDDKDKKEKKASPKKK